MGKTWVHGTGIKPGRGSLGTGRQTAAQGCLTRSQAGGSISPGRNRLTGKEWPQTGRRENLCWVEAWALEEGH